MKLAVRGGLSLRSEKRYPVGVVGQFTNAHGSLCASPLGSSVEIAVRRNEWVVGVTAAAPRRA